MTIEELLDSSPEVLEGMNDEELLQHFQQYLVVTRPELCTKPKNKVSEPERQIYISPAKKNALSMLEAEGVDLSFMNFKRKKK